MIEVEVGDLKKVEKELADLLKQRLKTDVAIKGGKLFLDQSTGRLSSKDAKLQVKHALRHLGLKDEYKVHSEHHIIRIVKSVEKTRPKVKKEGEVPAPSQSMPYFFP